MAVPVSEKGYASSTSPWWASLTEEETPELVWPQSTIVLDRMRTDAQVASVLRAVTLPLRRTTWRVDQAGARPEVAAEVADDLGLNVAGQPDRVLPRMRDRFSWSEHLRLALLKFVFGHSFFEQQYRWDPATKRFHLRKLAWRPPRTIDRIAVAKDGGLQGIHQWGMPSKELIEVGRLVAYSHDREGSRWEGRSILRPGYKFWLLKDPALRTWAISIERNGLGVPIATGGPIPDSIALAGEEVIQAWREEEKKAGLALATQFRGGLNAGAFVPHGNGLDLKGVTGRLLDPLPFTRYCDEQMGRTVLANFLNLGGDDSTGSYALGDTFADFFIQGLQTEATAVAETATQHIIEDWVDVNYGPDEPAPRLIFDEIGSKHQPTAEAISMLVNCGVLTPDAQLEQHVRHGYTLPSADATTARPQVKPTPTPTTGASA